MAIHYATEGIVFKKEDLLESDRVFSVFTRDFGRVEVVGRAIRKIPSKLRGGIDIFSLSAISFIQGRARKTLTEAITVETFKAVCQDPEKHSAALLIARIMDQFIKGEEPDKKIFSLAYDVLGKLNASRIGSVAGHMACDYFFWNFAALSGYRPELANCAACAIKLNPYILYFSNEDGGILCRSCARFRRDAVKIKSDIAKIIKIILRGDWDLFMKLKIGQSTRESLEAISHGYYRHLLSVYVQK